jgi:N-acyl amino acid synthase of PEP-CTERM/exosortase system
VARGAAPPSARPYFTSGGVRDADDLRAAYRIRFEVFCLERGFLRPEDYPGGEECDAYDAHALHFLASHVSGRPAGTVRLVPNGPLGLPMLDHCAFESRYRFLTDPASPRGRSYAEISRLAVSPEFRRRSQDGRYGGPARTSRRPRGAAGYVEPPRREASPAMLAQVFRLVYQESKRRGITHWVVAMEPGLNLMLRRMGFHFTAIGPETDYYGPVRPYLAEISALECRTGQQRRGTLAFMSAGLEPRLKPRVPPLPDALAEIGRPLAGPPPAARGAAVVANRTAAG